MTHDEQHASATQTGNSGPLERVRFVKDESGEKSLLDLIQDRSANRPPGWTPENRIDGFTNAIDDMDEANQADIDQMILRLGGNGF